MAKLLQTVTCPHCHEEIYPGECRVVSTIKYKNLDAGTVIREASPGLLSRIFATPLSGREFTRFGAVRICPHCDRMLPPNVERVKSYTIAIVGDSTSGKTLYLSSVIQQLQEAAAYQVIGYNSIVGQGKTDETYYNDYYVPLFLNKAAPSATPIAQNNPEPLIYELGFPGKSINLLFYDASGEDMVNAGQMAEYGHYILHASAIIFLADPMIMPGIRQYIPTHVKQAQSLPPRINTAQALNRIISTFRRSQSVNPGEKLKVPIAITISKSDLLDFTERTNNPPLYLRDLTLTNRVDSSQSSSVNQQVQDMLRRYGDAVLIPASKQFERVSFFAVSSTGQAPTLVGQNLEFPEIKPRRCLEPLLWVLEQLGIINYAE